MQVPNSLLEQVKYFNSNDYLVMISSYLLIEDFRFYDLEY